jgi:adenosylcobinamide-phosphate synthase
LTALLLAVALDVVLGEPPNRFHPVAWMGRALSWAARLARGPWPPHGGHRRRAWALVLAGGLAVAAVTAIAAGAAAVVGLAVNGAGPAGVLLEAIALKGAFSLRALRAAALSVRDALVAGELAGARRALGLHLVSRPTGELDAGHVASGAVESLAENLTDSWVAPVCFYALGGLPAAWAYRAVNTADAMLGYREGRLEYLGKVAARLDDALNWVPARLAALAIVAGAAATGESAAGAWRTLRRDGARTASPNAGRTMAAMAGALGVAVDKPGHYRLGAGALPDARAIDRAVKVAAAAALAALAAGGVALVLAGSP